MLSRTLEWHRIVDPKPTPDTIDRRTSSINEIVKALDDAKEWTGVLGSVVGTLVGFEHRPLGSDTAIQLILERLKAKDSTVPQDLSDNALELRAAAGTAIGEILSRTPNEHPSPEAEFIASSLLSGLNLRPRPRERSLKAMLDELEQAARLTQQRAQGWTRRRTAVGKKLMALDEKVDPPEPAIAIQQVIKAAKELATDFSRQAALDREELNILWWLFSQASATLAVPIESLPASKAAVVVGVELADMCILPPSESALMFVRRGAQLIKKADAKRSLERAADELDDRVWNLLAPPEGKPSLAHEFPALAPLTWLAEKLKASNGAAGWSGEFKAQTGLDPSISVDSFTIAEQAFLERTAQRFYQK